MIVKTIEEVSDDNDPKATKVIFSMLRIYKEQDVNDLDDEFESYEQIRKIAAEHDKKINPRKIFKEIHLQIVADSGPVPYSKDDKVVKFPYTHR